MFPVFVSHSSYQDAFSSRFLDAYPDPFIIPSHNKELIDLNPRRLGVFKYKHSFTIGANDISIWHENLRMHRDSVERSNKRLKKDYKLKV